MIELALLLAVPVLFVVGLKRPDRTLLLWLALSPLSQDKMILFGLNLRVISFDRLALLASALGLVCGGHFRDLFPFRFSKLEKAVVAFIAIFWLEAAINFSPRDAFSMCMIGFDSFAIPFYLYLLAKYLLTREGEYNDALEGRIAKTLTFVGLYCAAMSVYEGLTARDLFPPPFQLIQRSTEDSDLRGLAVGGELRTNGPFWIAEVLGEYLSLILLLTIYRWRVKPLTGATHAIWQKITAVPYAMLLLLGMYFTMYRNVWGGFVGGYSLRYLLTRKGRTTFLLCLTLASLVAAAAYGTFRESNFYQNRLTNTENIYDRLGAWLYSFRAFSEHPLVGIGYGRIKHYITSAQEAGDDLRFVEDVPATFHPHNTVIALLAENGVLLIVPFLLIVWYSLEQIRACVRLAKSPADIEFGLFAVSGAFALFAPHMTDRCLSWNKYNNLLFLFLALVAAHRAKLVTTPPRTDSERTPAEAMA